MRRIIAQTPLRQVTSPEPSISQSPTIPQMHTIPLIPMIPQTPMNTETITTISQTPSPPQYSPFTPSPTEDPSMTGVSFTSKPELR